MIENKIEHNAPHREGINKSSKIYILVQPIQFHKCIELERGKALHTYDCFNDRPIN